MSYVRPAPTDRATERSLPHDGFAHGTLMGRLVADPSAPHATKGGGMVTNFRLAVNVPGADAAFYDVAAWDRVADVAGTHLHKGSRVLVEGRLQQRRWADPNDGTVRERLELVANTLTMLGGGRSKDGAE